ncbi:MAG: hypothetical protein L6265_09655 [Thermoplasmatales archaeon]|nr:hypothetical protein [Candidatus Thermoplasmatota archaeon]MCG2826843.1 hypothetical protein [Thermoplasmatales archaeon]
MSGEENKNYRRTGGRMEILAYGEDALTLWALKNRLEKILKKLGDSIPVSQCKIFYRPSFGRKGGENSSQFGEFDFIVLSKNRLYLGESKWDGSSELKKGHLELRDEQKLRHTLFKCYVECWFRDEYSNWDDFIEKAKVYFEKNNIQKPIAPINSSLALNLQTILKIIRKHYRTLPEIRNVLLYLHKASASDLPKKVNENFDLVLIDYSKDTLNNLVRINI